MARTFLLALCMALASQAPALAQAPNAEVRVKSTFDNGRDDGWLGERGVDQILWIDSSLGNTAPALRFRYPESFGHFIETRNPEWLLALKQGLPVAIGLEARTLELIYLGTGLPTPRELVVEFRDYDNPPAGYPYVSVWKRIGILDPSKPDEWVRLGARIEDPRQTALPKGWGGYGDEDSRFRPRLPAGRTFANVLAGADAVAFTTFQPGRFYYYHSWDILFDNISMRAVQR
jgi:hypothetical protein